MTSRAALDATQLLHDQLRSTEEWAAGEARRASGPSSAYYDAAPFDDIAIPPDEMDAARLHARRLANRHGCTRVRPSDPPCGHRRHAADVAAARLLLDALGPVDGKQAGPVDRAVCSVCDRVVRVGAAERIHAHPVAGSQALADGACPRSRQVATAREIAEGAERDPRPPAAKRLARRRGLREDLAWTEGAECRGEDLVLFFGPDGERQPERDIRERKAKALCAQCPVRVECLDYAVSTPEKYGLWGGLNEDERAAERRRRMRRAAAQREGVA